MFRGCILKKVAAEWIANRPGDRTLTEAGNILAKRGKEWRLPFSSKPLERYRQLQRQELTDSLRLASYSDAWRSPFDNAPLKSHYWQVNRQLQASLHLAEKAVVWRRNIDFRVLDPVFGLNRSDHAFASPRIEWASRLTEPQATRTLAKLLSEGPVAIRARRIAAFLKALGLDDVSPDDLFSSDVIAERDHIDLQISWPRREGGKSVVIVEAKLDHKLTRGQLSGYHQVTRKNHRGANITSILLGLHGATTRRGLKGRQHGIWKFVSWRGLWLQFEKHRPEENNPNLSIFLHTLWHRIGGLEQRKKK